MKDKTSLSEYFNAMSDKVVNVGLMMSKSEEKYRNNLTEAEYKEYHSEIAPEAARRSAEAIGQPDLLNVFLSETYLEEFNAYKFFTDPFSQNISKKGLQAIMEASYESDERVFTGTQAKALRLSINAWNEAEDEMPKVTKGQLVPAIKVFGL